MSKRKPTNVAASVRQRLMNHAQETTVVEEPDDVLRCRQARRALEKRCKTLKGLFAYVRRLEQRRGLNIALAKKLLSGQSAIRLKVH